MKPERVGLVMGLLIFVIVVLVGVVLYMFVVTPYIDGIKATASDQGKVELLNSILLNIQQVGYVRIPIGDQQLILAPVQPTQ